MNIILSRKGFDSSSGGKPSPIINDKLISFPIPFAESGIFYRDLIFDIDISFLKVMKDLGINKFSETHLDPDLRKNILKNRPATWKPIFGQADIAQKILEDARIGPGDIFLFFGWFHEIEFKNNRFSYERQAPDLHVIYGYLEVDQVLRISEDIPSYAKSHPHYINRDEMGVLNSIYVGSDRFTNDPSKPGFGCFRYSEKLVLTDSSSGRRSIWKLPQFFKKEQNNFRAKVKITDKNSKEIIVDTNLGRSNQEIFISNSPKIQEWATKLIYSNDIYE